MRQPNITDDQETCECTSCVHYRQANADYEPNKIEAQHCEAVLWTSEGRTQYPGSSYEDGVAAALAWILGESEDAPIT